MGAHASHANENQVRYIAQYLPAAARPLDWDDVEGSAFEHALANTLKNIAMLRCKNAKADIAVLETMMPSQAKFRASVQRWKFFKGAPKRNVSWDEALDANEDSYASPLSDEVFLALLPSVQQESARWRDCDSSARCSAAEGSTTSITSWMHASPYPTVN